MILSHTGGAAIWHDHLARLEDRRSILGKNGSSRNVAMVTARIGVVGVCITCLDPTTRRSFYRITHLGALYALSLQWRSSNVDPPRVSTADHGGVHELDHMIDGLDAVMTPHAVLAESPGHLA